MIPITEPFLPPIEEYQAMIEGIWQRNRLTNNGPLVQELEEKLAGYLGTGKLLFVSSGTLALHMAIKALQLKGEIITTPYSHVATTSSIVWENCKPVFVDIEPGSFNINPELIEPAITDNTTAILAAHIYGNPCRVEEIREIAERHHLKVIYDAAHCFGTTYKGESIFNKGDISTASFHATKIFHTVEGGALFTSDEKLFSRIRYMRNFGHDGPYNFNGTGINGKNTELHAAMGLCNLKYMDVVQQRRIEQNQIYTRLLQNDAIRSVHINGHAGWNHSYYPVLFENESVMQRVQKSLEEAGISTRRYFYPRLDSLDYTERAELPVTEAVTSSILCLPLYHHLQKKEIERICSIILNELSCIQTG